MHRARIRRGAVVPGTWGRSGRRQVTTRTPADRCLTVRSSGAISTGMTGTGSPPPRATASPPAPPVEPQWYGVILTRPTAWPRGDTGAEIISRHLRRPPGSRAAGCRRERRVAVCAERRRAADACPAPRVVTPPRAQPAAVAGPPAAAVIPYSPCQVTAGSGFRPVSTRGPQGRFR
jgi:hypothetical protein